jgi:hypothetical protein
MALLARALNVLRPLPSPAYRGGSGWAGAGMLLRLILLVLAAGGGEAMAADAAYSVADVKGKWVGEFHQDSHETTGVFALLLTVDAVSGDEFSGTIDWPDNNDCRTKVQGAFDGRVLKWTETEYLRGDDVVLGGLYIGRFENRGRIAGTWMDPKHNIYPKGPNYGTPGGTFVLRKQQ